jgi:nucleoside-diphosphate-sugar epimerase
MSDLTFFLTGGTGLVGRGVTTQLLAQPRVARVFVLARDASAFGAGRQIDSGRLVPIHGDMLLPGLGIDIASRERLAREVTGVVHLAADTSFSQTLENARAVNRDGTRRLLELSADWAHVTRWLYASTAFVQGCRTGVIADDDGPASGGWLNAYEQSKAESELLVCAERGDWVIARPSTIVCDDRSGAISQMNAVHRALRLYFGGLAAMLPGTDTSTLDVVTTDYVARGIARLALAASVDRQTFHLCAGAGAIPLDELLDRTHIAFERSPAWRRKGIARPLRADLETYRAFERAIDDAASERVKRAVRSLGFFVPQLAYPKQFCTARSDALLGHAAPPVRDYWSNMVAVLAGSAQEKEAA